MELYVIGRLQLQTTLRRPGVTSGLNRQHWEFSVLSEKFSVVSGYIESLILAQDERWRRALGMQIERSCLTFVRHFLKFKIQNAKFKIAI